MVFVEYVAATAIPLLFAPTHRLYVCPELLYRSPHMPDYYRLGNRAAFPPSEAAILYFRLHAPVRLRLSATHHAQATTGPNR